MALGCPGLAGSPDAHHVCVPPRFDGSRALRFGEIRHAVPRQPAVSPLLRGVRHRRGGPNWCGVFRYTPSNRSHAICCLRYGVRETCTVNHVHMQG
eukprot:2554548-Pyramimonas_sp.AAC.1